MAWQDTLDFLYGRNAQENPRPQDPTIFSAPCDEFFYLKLQGEIGRYCNGESTPEALKEAFTQLTNHTSIPVAAYTFWKDVKLFACITEFFHECAKGGHKEGTYHWTDMIVRALAKLVDTRGGTSTLELLPLEQMDTILTFLLNELIAFPPLWHIITEISYTAKLLKGYERNVIQAGTNYLAAILTGFTDIKMRLEEDRASNFTLPEHRRIQAQIMHLKHVIPAVYNVLITSHEIFELVTDTAPNTFLDRFKQLYDLIVVAVDHGFCPTAESVMEMNTFITNVIVYDCTSALSFSTGTLPRNLILLFNDFNINIASTAALAFGQICSSNAAVQSVWETLMFDENMECVKKGFAAGFVHTDEAFRDACCHALLSMLDGPFRVKKDTFKDVIFNAEVASKNGDNIAYAELQALFD